MNDAQRIEEKLKQELKVALNAPVTFAQFTSYLNELSRGRVDAQITEEIWGQMTEAESTPTLRRFPGIFIEAIQRIDGKLVQLEQQIREGRDAPPPTLSAGDFNPSFEYLIFRALELTGPIEQGLLFEFDQSGKTARMPYANFRHHDALVRGYDRTLPLRVRLINAMSGSVEATFDIFSAEAGHGSRATVEKLLPALGPQCSVFCQLQTLRSAPEYAASLRTFNEENFANLEEIRGEFRRIRENIGAIFASNVINYARLPPLLFDAESQLNFRNNALHGYSLLDLVDTLAAERYSAQSAQFKDNGIASLRSYDGVPTTSAAQLGFSSSSPIEAARLPMNLSPFAASVAAAATTPTVAASNPFGAAANSGGFNASWNPKLEFAAYLAAGLAVGAILCSVAKPSFLPLLVALSYTFWHQFRNEHDYHIPPLFFIGGSAAAFLLDLLWTVTQFHWCWIRGGSGGQGAPLLDRLFMLCVFPCLGLEAALVYFLLTVQRQGVYIASGGLLNAVKRPPLNLAF